MEQKGGNDEAKASTWLLSEENIDSEKQNMRELCPFMAEIVGVTRIILTNHITQILLASTR